jgi:hypothetical protein
MAVVADTTQTTHGSLRLLRALFFTAVAVSVVHYVDNFVNYEDFVAADPAQRSLAFITKPVIVTAWVVLTACGVAGYRLYRDGRHRAAAPWLAAYSGSGLVGFGHYLDRSPSELALYQNAHVIADIVMGVAIMAFAIWTLRRT